MNHIVINDRIEEKNGYRIWVDGCFDMMHFGHANALRQAKDTGGILVIGIHSDEEIAKHKGPSIMTLEERIVAVKGCRWADEIVSNAPYTTSTDVMKKYNCDFCVHGNDVTTSCDGADCYAEVKKAGLYREVKRTQGVSTTELVGRMLTLDRGHLKHLNSYDYTTGTDRFFLSSDILINHAIFSRILPKPQLKKFIPQRLPNKNDTVVYVDGSFDLFHYGHIEFLKNVKALGTFLVVGVYSDKLINTIKGSNYPIMNIGERVLGLLSCRYVDEVIVNAPHIVSAEFLSAFFPIHIVCRGIRDLTPYAKSHYFQDAYKVPKDLGIYRVIETPNPDSITADIIINRVINNRKKYEERERRKLIKESEINNIAT